MLQLKHDIQSPNHIASLPLPLPLPLPLSVGGLPSSLSLAFGLSFTTQLPLALHMKEANMLEMKIL
jgi:hypothetical protein